MTHGEAIRLKILEIGASIWLEKSGKITSNDVAQRLGMTQANVLYHFKTVENLRGAVARYAVQNDQAAVILHLISIEHDAIAGLSRTKRAEYIKRAL